RRNPILDVRGILMVDRALISAEEEQLVAQNWTAGSPTELVPFERAVYLLTRLGIDPRKICRGVQQIVANEFKQAAMKVIRTGLRDRIRLCAGVLALRRRQRAGFYLELLQRVRKRQRQAQIVVWIVMLRAVQRIIHAAGKATGNSD